MEIVKVDLDDIIFKSKNKEYGSYELRKRAGRNIFLGFVFGVLLIGTLMSLPVLASLLAGEEELEELVYVDREIELLEPPVDNEEELPEEIDESPPPPPQREEIKFVPPDVVDDDDAPEDQTIRDMDDLVEDEADIGRDDVEGDPDADDMPSRLDDLVGTGTGDKVPVPVKEEPDPNAFIAVDRQPQPVNMDDLKKKIKYPEVAREMGIQGKVILKILVDEEGAPKKHLVMRSPHQSLTDAALKEIYTLKFTPAIQGGKSISFWATVPIDFNLNR